MEELELYIDAANEGNGFGLSNISKKNCQKSEWESISSNARQCKSGILWSCFSDLSGCKRRKHLMQKQFLFNLGTNR